MLSRTATLLLRDAQSVLKSSSRGGLAALSLLRSPSESDELRIQQPQQSQQRLHSAATHCGANFIASVAPSAVSPVAFSLQQQRLADTRFTSGQLQHLRKFFNFSNNAGSQTGKHYRERRLMG